ncbi:MAG: hypothetical protein JNK49_05045 [Planctomycetes bacterium]|nr:hypothetical protein [Planctomycetota bacterium]
MADPDTVVAKVATTPAQAKIWVALLQGAGIPAYTDGDSLADEIAVSRRVLNLNGTRVFVPKNSLDRARELLTNTQVDEQELEAQALAAADPETPPARPADQDRRRSAWPLAITSALMVVFLAFWLTEVDQRVRSTNPNFRYEPIPNGLREVRKSDGFAQRELFDRNGDGNHEQQILHHTDGSREEWLDADEDGVAEIWIVYQRNGGKATWTCSAARGQFDRCVVQDAKGNEVQRLRWQPDRGFVPE